MNEHEPFSRFDFTMSRLIGPNASFLLSSQTVTDLYGPDEARLSANDGLDESELTDSPP
jgi:hypothetical protein